MLEKIVYNKLVRDRIPEIIEKSGKKSVTEKLEEKTYIKMLEIKLSEELDEYLASSDIEELADLMEVIYALSEAKGVSVTELEKIRVKKAQERGGFSEKILLKEVIE